MHKITCSIALFAGLFSQQIFAETSVWKVSKGDDFIHVAGTVHLLPASEYPLPSAFTQAYQQSQTVVLEAPLPATMAEQQQMMQQLQYSGGKTLSTQLNPKVRTELSEYLLSLGVPLAMVDQFKPGFVSMQLTILEMAKAGLVGDGVDQYFLTQAKKDSKSLAYLETLSFQIDLIANLGAEDPNTFIKMSIDEAKTSSDLLKKLIKAWRSGDMNFIHSEVLLKTQQQDPATYRLMFSDRNQRWLPHLAEMFTQPGHEFVLVGAAHLPGDEGVLKLLSQAGYKLEQIN